jgi:hypothetical protein
LEAGESSKPESRRTSLPLPLESTGSIFRLSAEAGAGVGARAGKCTGEDSVTESFQRKLTSVPIFGETFGLDASLATAPPSSLPATWVSSVVPSQPCGPPLYPHGEDFDKQYLPPSAPCTKRGVWCVVQK